MKKITIKDVAKDAGVSITTASFAMNNVKGRVSEKMRSKVLFSAQKLGYIPNTFAKNLRSRNSNTLALVYEEYFLEERNASTLQFVAGAVKYAKNRGKDILIKLNDYRADQNIAFREYSDLYTSGRVDGLIFYCRVAENKYLQSLKDIGVNLVVIPHEEKLSGFNTVYIDNFLAMKRAVEFIHTKGYTEIYYLTINEDKKNDRELGFLSAIRTLGVGGRSVYYSSRYRGKGEIWEAVKEIIESRENRIAFACWNDVDAINLIDILHSHGVDIPGEVGIMGFDDIASGEYTRPSLTTVRQPFSEMAGIAVDVLLDNVDNLVANESKSIEAPCIVIERNSI